MILLQHDTPTTIYAHKLGNSHRIFNQISNEYNTICNDSNNKMSGEINTQTIRLHLIQTVDIAVNNSCVILDTISS